MFDLHFNTVLRFNLYLQKDFAVIELRRTFSPAKSWEAWSASFTKDLLETFKIVNNMFMLSLNIFTDINSTRGHRYKLCRGKVSATV